MRCANCGAELTAAVCENCGLNRAEAGRAMRRSLVNRLGIFLLGAIAFFVPCFVYPPLELDSILIFFGVIFFITIALAMWAERRSIRRQEVELLKHIFHSLVLVPWLLGGFLFINGALDHSVPHDVESTVVSRLAVPGILPVHQLIVTSWREGRAVERIAVTRQDFDRFHVGDHIEVRVKEGLVSIPWVFGVYNE
ncbi:MAG TPA: hypothetical protein VKS20_01525 [Candidatus Acidoferrales bacterium]|nr:hypothetical protein [Candidatus Acidoferrales bacterium]